LGDAKNLEGGTLLVTTLLGADGNVYAVAQGSLAISGFQAEGDAARITRGVPTVGRIANGAIIEREIDFGLNRLTQIRLGTTSVKTLSFSGGAVTGAVNVALNPTLNAATLTGSGGFGTSSAVGAGAGTFTIQAAELTAAPPSVSPPSRPTPRQPWQPRSTPPPAPTWSPAEPVASSCRPTPPATTSLSAAPSPRTAVLELHHAVH
jgi:hypothetical protein